MIDYENDIFSHVASELRSRHSGIFVSGEYVDTPASFPAVTIVQADNRVYQRMRTTKIENAVSVMFECNVYSNKTNGKKAQAKAIAADMDAVFEEMGFTRIFCNQVANLADAKIFRLVCRYEAVIDPNFWIYQND